jgi:hypothetical protein
MNAPLPLLPWGFTLHIKHLEKFPSVFRGHLIYMNIFLRKRRDITYFWRILCLQAIKSVFLSRNKLLEPSLTTQCDFRFGIG